MPKYFRLLCSIATAGVILATSDGCSSVPPTTLAVIGGTDTISVAEFEDRYTRLRNSRPETMAQREDFLRLLVDNRVKLAEARSRGLAQDKALAAEIAEYRDQLATSYYLDVTLVDPAVRLLYARRQEEVRFSHIIIRWKRDQSNIIDTLATYQAAAKLLDRALAGAEPFDTLVVRYSEDPQVEKTHGSIGWLIAGSSMPQVDDIVYSMKVGEVYPHLMKTTFGYHVVKLTGRKKARLRLRASQILDRLDINNPSDTSASFARLSLILDSLKSGKATFEALARRNSQDPVSGANGGDLGWVDRGVGLEQHFEEALFNLPVGETSAVIRSAFGMHIIRVTDEAPPPAFEQQESNLREIYKRERFEDDARVLLEDLRKKYAFKSNIGIINLIIAHTDPAWTTSTPNWDARLSVKEKEAFLFTITGRNVSIREVIADVAKEPFLQMRRFTVEGIDSVALALADRYILVEETRNLEKTHPAFNVILQEFSESALVSRLEQDALWARAAVTEDMLRSYWEIHKAEFTFPNRVNFSEIHVYTESMCRALIDSLKAGADFAALASRHTKRTGMFDKGGSWGFQPVHRNELSEAANKLSPGEVSEPVRMPPGWSIVRLDAKDPARQKTFEEARNEVAAKVKEETIAANARVWLGELRAKYGAETFPEHLQNAFPAKRQAMY
jgi:peptidyl-prolyl cis-trans isomerase SurA